MIYIFVEGADDERFFSNYFAGKAIKIIQYAKMEKKAINGLIKSLSGKNIDFIFTADSDGKTVEEKIEQIADKYGVDQSTVYIVQYEIESWYLAGINDCETRKYGMKYYSCTDEITKEKFNSMCPKKLSSLTFKIEILKKYDFDLAKERNKTFKCFAVKNEREQAV